MEPMESPQVKHSVLAGKAHVSPQQTRRSKFHSEKKKTVEKNYLTLFRSVCLGQMSRQPDEESFPGRIRQRRRLLILPILQKMSLALDRCAAMPLPNVSSLLTN
ncbi:hypothetical protein PoB_000939000 [Plakobranchus ocellatus]|uniref:Uncharacterized protein n=1 Tax=Plakobranchus ocellatus TaxID=259542 RepID=A0AAV3YK59_9GAST|nr:hypothetical protein PoB_000939000 [Plakobranchus ocellatus]